MNSLLYIDPGTGALLFTTILGLVTSLSFVIMKALVKIKFFFAAGGRVRSNQINMVKRDFVIFSDDKRYWNVFKPICDEFEKRQVECEYWTASEDDPALSEKYDYVKCCFIGKGGRAYARLNVMNAVICLATTPGLQVYQWKKSKNVAYYVHIMHAVAGLELYRMFGIDYFDAVLLSGGALEPELRELEKLRNLKPKEVAIVGSTYMDDLLKKHRDYRGSRIREDNDPYKISVLVAPSWGGMSLFNRYGSELLRPLYKSDYNIVIRPHPQSYTSESELIYRLQKEFPEKNNWKWNRDNDNFIVLEESDILISDFSGIIFDYAFVFNKPIIFSNYDFDNSQYDACWFDHPTFMDRIQSGLGRSITHGDMPHICDVIQEMVSAKDLEQEKRTCVKGLCWENIGNAAETTVDWLIHKHDAQIEVRNG